MPPTIMLPSSSLSAKPVPTHNIFFGSTHHRSTDKGSSQWHVKYRALLNTSLLKRSIVILTPEAADRSKSNKNRYICQKISSATISTIKY